MPLIHLKNRFVEYKFEIINKYTLVQGDSANGKTTLHEIVSEYASHPGNIQCPGYAKLRVMPELMSLQEYEMILTGVSECVFIMDEGSTLLRLRGYEQALQNSDNYFIILYRLRKFGNLSVSLDSVCTIKTSGRFHTLVPLYATAQKGAPCCVITEDSQSGNKFIKEVIDRDYMVEHAGTVLSKDTGGKDALSRAIRAKYLRGEKNIGIVFDRAGIGTAYDAVNELKERYQDLNLFEVDWESFEHYILSSDVYNFDFSAYDVRYESMEQYAQKEMRELMFRCLDMAYKKDTLPICFRRSRCRECRKEHKCRYSRFTFEDLVYEKVEHLKQALSNPAECSAEIILDSGLSYFSCGANDHSVKK